MLWRPASVINLWILSQLVEAAEDYGLRMLKRRWRHEVPACSGLPAAGGLCDAHRPWLAGAPPASACSLLLGLKALSSPT